MGISFSNFKLIYGKQGLKSVGNFTILYFSAILFPVRELLIQSYKLRSGFADPTVCKVEGRNIALSRSFDDSQNET